VNVAPLVPVLANFFDDVLNKSVSELNLKSIIDGLGEVLYRFPFQVPAYYALIARSLTVLEGIAMRSDPKYKVCFFQPFFEFSYQCFIPPLS
jgi:aarF domain-containing kinase